MKASLIILMCVLSILSMSPFARAEARQEPQQRRSNSGYWFVRVQQLPLLGLAALSDTGVADVEFMKVINPNIHIGPTIMDIVRYLACHNRVWRREKQNIWQGHSVWIL